MIFVYKVKYIFNIIHFIDNRKYKLFSPKYQFMFKYIYFILIILIYFPRIYINLYIFI
jgi:hypothetical protein